MGPKERVAALTELLANECGELTDPEKRLVRSVVLGEACDLLYFCEKTLTFESDFDAWKAWGEHRRVRAVVLRAICTLPGAHALVAPRGVSLLHAAVTGEFDLDGASVPFDLLFGWCSFECSITAYGTRVQSITMKGSQVPGLSADGLEARGGVSLSEGFEACGEVSLLGARIGGDLYCTGGRFYGGDGQDPKALSADGLEVRGSVYLDDNRGPLVCDESDDGKVAWISLYVGDGFEASGEVRLIGARIGGVLTCNGGGFRNKKGGTAFNFQGATVTEALHLLRLEIDGIVDLTGSRIGYLVDTSPLPEQILLGDCRYDAIDAESPLSAKARLKWLASHDQTIEDSDSKARPTDPQPYRWLARVLRKQGHERDADKVMEWLGWRRWRSLLRHRLRGDFRTRASAVPLFVLSFFYGIVVGHGYARFRPVYWLALFFVLGMLIFSQDDGRHMQPTQSYVLRAWTQAKQAGWDATPLNPATINDWFDTKHEAGVVYPKSTWQQQQLTDQELRWIASYLRFSPWVYSLDAFLPLVDFHQEDYWTPASGWWAKDWYLPFHIISGWIIATLFAASFTRLARQD